jgi:peptide/nickel transport system ATP-binding protein
VPSPTNVPRGCPFHTRCPRCLGEVCMTETPPWREGAQGQRIFCHIPLDELAALQHPVAAAEVPENAVKAKVT